MTKIFKYPLVGADGVAKSTLKVPAGAKPLYVGLDADEVACVWMLVETSQMEVDYPFWIFGTGWEIPSLAIKYFGTFKQGPFIWHVFFRA